MLIMLFMVNTCYQSGALVTEVTRCCKTTWLWLSPNKSTTIELSWTFLVGNTSHLSQTSLEEELRSFYATPLGGMHRSLRLVYSGLCSIRLPLCRFSPVFFYCNQLQLCIWQLLHSVSPSSKLWNLKVILGTPKVSVFSHTPVVNAI